MPMPLLMRTRNDKREHGRMDLYARALVKKEGSEHLFSGEITNVCDKGAYLKIHGPYHLNEPVDVTIYFQHDTKRLAFTAPCKVVRIDGMGVGLSSSHIDVNTLLRLELILAVSKENTKQLIEDFFKII